MNHLHTELKNNAKVKSPTDIWLICVDPEINSRLYTVLTEVCYLYLLSNKL